MEDLNKDIFVKLNSIQNITQEIKQGAIEINKKLVDQNHSLDHINMTCEKLDVDVNKTTNVVQELNNHQSMKYITYGAILTSVGVGALGLIIGSTPILASSLISVPIVLTSTYFAS